VGSVFPGAKVPGSLSSRGMQPPEPTTAQPGTCLHPPAPAAALGDAQLHPKAPRLPWQLPEHPRCCCRELWGPARRCLRCSPCPCSGSSSSTYPNVRALFFNIFLFILYIYSIYIVVILCIYSMCFYLFYLYILYYIYIYKYSIYL